MGEQLLRIVLPTGLLVQVDEHLAAEGSSRTRADFVREAVEQRLLEVRLGEPNTAATEPTSKSPTARLPQPPLASEEVDLSDEPLLQPRSLADTELPGPAGATVAHPGAGTFPIEPGPLFLHGRDYPSLWSLTWLTRWADEGPLALSEFLHEVTLGAWIFAQALKDFDRTGGLKPTTMFPTNPARRDSASQTFQAAAIGGLVRRRGGSKVVVGPLALWRTVQIFQIRNQVFVAPTELGINLLARLEGLSLELPHSAEQADVFLSHLRESAPSDGEAFQKTLAAVEDEPNRERLIATLARAGLADSEKLADVYAQAYVSRGREWGLIEPKLVERRYRLTDQGRAMLQR